MKGTTISLKEEEIVSQIIAEVGSNRYIDLDQQLMHIINTGEAEIEAEYESQAEQRMLKHRVGINFDEIKQSIDLELQQQKIVEPPKQQQSELQMFEEQTIKKTKRTEKEIMQLDMQFPKLNYANMVNQQQKIIDFYAAEAFYWVNFKKLACSQMQTAVMCIIGEKRWILMGVENELVIFMGQYQREPVIMRQNGTINAIAVSPCKKYVYVAFNKQINIYEIRKSSMLVLLKNFPQLKVGKIIKLIAFEGAGPRMCFWDQKYQTGMISLEIGMILTKVRLQDIPHQLKTVESLDVLKLNVKCTLLCIGGGGKVKLFKIQPDIKLIQTLEVGSNVNVSWRRPKQKMHLLIASQNKITIYKLIYEQNQEFYYLEQHLLFLNHYHIQKIFRISDFHYLIQSTYNYAVIALPLIQTVVDAPDLSLSQAAIVFSFQRKVQNKVIFANQEGFLLNWNGILQIAKLKTLQFQVDELMIQKSAYRESFSLLVLVAKGMNYSFKFSYSSQDLKKLISSALELATSAIIPSLDQKIVLFRIGWIVQFCIECGQQQLLWTHLYPRLKDKKIEKNLYQMLQIFVLKCQLIAIPEDIFLDIVKYYSQRGQQQVIQKLVLSNRQQYEPTKLLSLLNHSQMNYLQFYLFSRAILSDQHDFYTPYIRAFSAFAKHLQQRNDKIQESGLLCFWILYKTFRFQHAPTGHMTRDTKVHIGTVFFLQTLSKIFIRKLSDYNQKLFLQCYLIPFFNSEFMDIFSDYQNEIMKSFQDFDVQGQITQQHQFFVAYLAYLQHCVGAARTSSLFAEYYATVLFVTRSVASFERVIQLVATLFQKKFYYYNLRLSIGERPSVSKLKEYLLSLIKQDLMKRPDRLYIKKLLAFEDREIGHLLYRIDKNYQSALELYLGNYGVNNLFQFTTQIVQEIKMMPDDNSFLKQRKLIEVRSFIIKNISLLFRTNSYEALELCYLLGETTQKIHQIIFKNPFQNNERIHFLTAVLTRWNTQEFEFKQQYQLEHLEQVCMLAENQMRDYLDRFYYPLDPAIKVADKKNNFLAKAVLEMRSGLIEQAFLSYQKLIKTTLVTNKGQEQSRHKVSRYIDQCIAICKQYSGDSLQQNLWVRLIKFLASFVASEHQYKVYLKVELERASQNIINQMLRFLSTTLLILFFTSPTIPLPLYKLIPIFFELFRMVKYDISNIQRSMLIVKLDLLNFRKSIATSSKLGLSLYGSCDFCRGKLEQQSRSVCYSCGHGFHQLCHEDTSMCLTCSYQSDDSLFYRNIFRKNEIKKQSKPKDKKKLQMNKDIYVQTKTQALLQARKKKLKLFDFEQDLKSNSVYQLANRTFRLGELQLSGK